MKPAKSTQGMSEAEKRFWERYAGQLIARGVAGKKAGWLISRAQDFAYSLEGKRLREVSEEDAERWLGELGGNRHLELWQLKQAHEAVRFLLTRMLPESDHPSIPMKPPGGPLFVQKGAPGGRALPLCLHHAEPAERAEARQGTDQSLIALIALCEILIVGSAARSGRRARRSRPSMGAVNFSSAISFIFQRLSDWREEPFFD